MPSRIEDYALLGDCHSAALVSRDGSVDWLCFPRFDSGACFAALLGEPAHGRWKIAPHGEVRRIERRYRPGTLVLETDFHTAEGVVTVIDFMPSNPPSSELVRIVVGKSGAVNVSMDLVIRFDYGSVVPWVRRVGRDLVAVGGPDALRLCTDAPVHGKDFRTVSEFRVARGERVPFVLSWFPSHDRPPARTSAERALEGTTRWWRAWARRCTFEGEHEEAVGRSLLTLKALTYAPTGAVVAAATTSLPERLGGVRNWDYRLSWLRDATFTLYSLLSAGYEDEAVAWQTWLLRAVAGKPAQMQIMYGLSGERRLTEQTLPWLPGYLGARPVRTGNGAHAQLQLDVFGEVMDALHLCRRRGLAEPSSEWSLQRALTRHLERIWREPDEGIWEVRGGRRPFTHSKVMAWVAIDRAVKAVECYGLEGPVARWRKVRAAIHRDVCANGYDRQLGAFVQSYGSKLLDASLLMIPLVGFLPPTDPRVKGTVRAIERGLVRGGLVERYASGKTDDGLPPGEGVFLACSFWLADNLVLQGRRVDAKALFARLLALRNDVGLLAEQYDPVARRQLGNFPQAFSHVSLVNTARNLTAGHEGPARHRLRA